MTGLRGFDLDGETSRAWKSFAGRLADHLADMQDGDTLSIGLVGLPTEAPGSVPSAVTFTGLDGSLVRAEIRMDISPAAQRDHVTHTDSDLADSDLTDSDLTDSNLTDSNLTDSDLTDSDLTDSDLTDSNLTDSDLADSELANALDQLGWQLTDEDPADEPIGDGLETLSADYLHGQQVVPLREADHLSSLTVKLLCEVLGAVHPVFLRVSGDSDLIDRSWGEGPAESDDGLDPLGVTEPVDSAHLRELVTRTIALDLGAEPTTDGDDDIVLEVGTARIFVRVLDKTPVIQIFGRLVHNVRHPFEAPSVVAGLNADYSFIKFLYADNAVLACVHLPAIPFVPAQLRRMLASFAEIAGHLDHELVRRLGGDREIEPGQPSSGPVDEPEGVPPELLTLLQLDPGGVGLDAELTAEICGYDRALARQLLHIAGGQAAVWQTAADARPADPGEAARCIEEAAGWQATRRSLATALELINSLDSYDD